MLRTYISENHRIFLFSLSYDCQAEILSRFLDHVSFGSKESPPTKSAPTEPEPEGNDDSIPSAEPLAADVVDPLPLGPGTAASEFSRVGAAAGPCSTRAIDHRVGAASTGIDNGTKSERGSSSKVIEGETSSHDSGNNTEESPLTPIHQPPSRLKQQLPDLDLESDGWTDFKSIIRIPRNNSAASPKSKSSAAVSFGTCQNNVVSPIQAGSRVETPLQLSTAASGQGPEQASSDIRQKVPSTPFRWPSRHSRQRRTQDESTGRALLRTDSASPRTDLGSPSAMWLLHAESQSLTPSSAVKSPKRALPSHEVLPSSQLTSPPSQLTSEDPSWEASSRPPTPVEEDIVAASGSKAYRNIALSFHQSPHTPAIGLPFPEPLLSRQAYKELLLVKMQKWRPNRDLQELKDLIHYEDEADYRTSLSLIEIAREQKRYEHYARQKKLHEKRAFHIYGTEELFALDCLKSWVKLRLHHNPSTPFPPGYTVITNEADAVSTTGTLYTQPSESQESDEYESTASESSKGKGKQQ